MLCRKGILVTRSPGRSDDITARPRPPCCTCYLGNSCNAFEFLRGMLSKACGPSSLIPRHEGSAVLGLDPLTVSAYGSLRALPVSRTSRPLPYLKRNCTEGQWNTECEVKAMVVMWCATGVWQDGTKTNGVP